MDTANEFENRLDAIRVELYEETRHMSNADAAKAINKSGRRIAGKYEIPLVKGAARRPAPEEDAR